MDNHEILDRPEIRKRFSGQWMSAKFFLYGLGTFIASQVLLRGLAWLLASQDWLTEGIVKVISIFFFLGGFAFVFFNLLGIITAFTYISGGKDKGERVAGWVGLVINLIPIILLVALLME